MHAKNTIPAETWDEYAEIYEVGYKNGAQIARELGVSPQTVMREMRARGAVKGQRTYESVKELEAELDRKRIQRINEESERWHRNFERTAHLVDAFGRLIEMLTEADRTNDFSKARAMTERIRGQMKADGINLSKRAPVRRGR